MTKYTFEEFTGLKNSDEINDDGYKKDIEDILNKTTDNIKRDEIIAMIKSQHPKILHFCSSQCRGCPYTKQIIKEFKV